VRRSYDQGGFKPRLHGGGAVFATCRVVRLWRLSPRCNRGFTVMLHQSGTLSPLWTGRPGRRLDTSSACSLSQFNTRFRLHAISNSNIYAYCAYSISSEIKYEIKCAYNSYKYVGSEAFGPAARFGTVD